MKQVLASLILLLGLSISNAQFESSFQSGEWLKFKLNYSGWVKAGNATLEVKEATYKNRAVCHVVGKGWTTGAIKWFFKVNDLYESYFDKATGRPYKFIRNISEGGHVKNRVIEFDYEKNLAFVNDLRHKTKKTVAITSDIQDMVSAYYYLRDHYNTETIKVGDTVKLNMFFDNEIFGFKLKFLGRETISTKFGNINCLKFRPYVMAGRVFHEEESVTLWVSADNNKIPIKIKADLRVGSLRSDLVAFKGLKYPFEIQL
ncbi:MAG: DUF3108 domain-containing protein [Flavobacteriaceae bacterium]|tara:strand:+ start:73 stop:849 length:777 start_codon:yes stop_codon:yes gene_type:complete